MPALGQTSDELRLLKWHKAHGEQVSEGDLLLEIETDKATLDVEASVSGTLLRIDCSEGETVTAGSILGWLGEPGEQIVEQEAPPAPVAAPPPPRHQAAPPVSHDRVLATPAARILAKQLEIDLSQVRGTGPGGRIERRDVEAARL
jgi:pyruvate dehydrogenase E2 component (dihydrolipoamide acetyltransferase)